MNRLPVRLTATIRPNFYFGRRIGLGLSLNDVILHVYYQNPGMDFYSAVAEVRRYREEYKHLDYHVIAEAINGMVKSGLLTQDSDSISSVDDGRRRINGSH